MHACAYRTVIVAPVVCGVIVLTILPLVLGIILAYCVTGYIRDVLFHKVVISCVRPCCNILVRVNKIVRLHLLKHIL